MEYDDLFNKKTNDLLKKSKEQTYLLGKSNGLNFDYSPNTSRTNNFFDKEKLLNTNYNNEKCKFDINNNSYNNPYNAKSNDFKFANNYYCNDDNNLNSNYLSQRAYDNSKINETTKRTLEVMNSIGKQNKDLPYSFNYSPNEKGINTYTTNRSKSKTKINKLEKSSKKSTVLNSNQLSNKLSSRFSSNRSTSSLGIANLDSNKIKKSRDISNTGKKDKSKNKVKLNSMEKKKKAELQVQKEKLIELNQEKKDLLKKFKENEKKINQLPELSNKVENLTIKLKEVNKQLYESNNKRDGYHEVIKSLQREIYSFKSNLKRTNPYFNDNKRYDEYENYPQELTGKTSNRLSVYSSNQDWIKDKLSTERLNGSLIS